ncbi:MAG TPA: ABC-F family ATP-binding cassette domain-containing protein [Thermoanaerobaculaceae bacterium]|nr:ABC-F family ATP-binding cassette domain-containing protein [Thermoanaerobaculaceae bacterium]
MLYRLEGVELSFAGREVLRGATFQHNPGEKLLLLGRNGCGKTTLLKLITGELEPERGSVLRARGFEAVTVEQRVSAPGDTPVLDYCLSALPRVVEVERALVALEGRLDGGDGEAIAEHHRLQEEFERLDGYRVRPRAQAALLGLGITEAMHARTLATLSGGERTRVALARALLSRSPLLLLDEPTNHLDLVGVEFLAQELARRDGALLLVTHDRELVDRVGGEVLELHGGRLERYPAGYARYRRERGARREQARRAFELQRAEIERQEEFIRRNIAGQNTRQAQARQKLLDRMTRLEPPEPDLAALKLRWPQSGRSGQMVVEAGDLAVGWTDPVLRGISFTLRRGERLAVVGRNGAGKSTLLHALAGRAPALAGRLRFGTGVVPAWYDQEQAEIPNGVSVLEVLLTARPEWTPAEARGWAARFAFSGEAAEAATDSLSGGERARLALARLIALAPNLMLLDEPTNHLDLVTCEVLEEALAEFPGALLLVSHDRRLVEKVATGVLLLEGGSAVAVNRVEEAFARLGLVAPPRRGEEGDEPPARRRSAEEEERRRLRRDAARTRERADALAVEMERSEGRLHELDELLCRREVFSNGARARELAAEAEALRASLEDQLEAWGEAEEDAEALEVRLAELERP